MVLEMIQGCELFEGLNDKQLKLFEEAFEVRHYSKDETVFSQGDTDNSLYIVGEGQVSIRFLLNTDTGTIKPIINKIDKHGFFGEFALIDSQPRTATVTTTIKNTLLLKITKENFYAIMENHTEIGYLVMSNFLRILTHRIRQTDQQLQGALLIGWNAYKFDQF